MLMNQENQYWENLHALDTVKEIFQQPSTWLKTLNQIKELRTEIDEFVSKVTRNQCYDVIFTGAGTSEFVGSSVFAYINHKVNYQAKSYGTTDILSSPSYFLSKDKPTLIVSFARSGNSPESVAVVNLANQYCNNVYHLFITCNVDGALSKIASQLSNAYAINLTDETHDQSFVMTSSFSNMTLASLLIFDANLETQVELLAKTGEETLANYRQYVDIVKSYNFERIIYLGANSLKGIAQESALKMLELTAGNVATMHDTPLGFRHGPKSIINDQSLVVTYLSNEEYARKYELDLVREMSGQRKGNKLLIVGANLTDEERSLVDFAIENGNGKLANCLQGLNDIIVAQILALYKALSYNITPDNPCPSGEVNRVVKGVIVHPYKED